MLASPSLFKKKGDWHKEMKDELMQHNAVTAITGATITTKAVTQSIEEGIQKLHKALHCKRYNNGLLQGIF